VTGRFDFGGTDVRSLDDLTGVLEAGFQQIQALQLPVFQQLAPFLGGGKASSLFQRGDLRARLARGLVRVERLSFAGTLLQLFADGTVTLQQGRLNLDVIANTGQLGVNPSFLRVLGLRVPAVGPIPVSLLLQATSYLSNRILHLRVTGTLRSPVISIEPLSLLTEEAFRYFLNQSAVPLP
jgi:translocation and assembly module TamB